MSMITEDLPFHSYYILLEKHVYVKTSFATTAITSWHRLGLHNTWKQKLWNLDKKCQANKATFWNKQGDFVTGVGSSNRLENPSRKMGLASTSTTFYLQAKFQLQIYCISWDIVWRKKCYFWSRTQPAN